MISKPIILGEYDLIQKEDIQKLHLSQARLIADLRLQLYKNFDIFLIGKLSEEVTQQVNQHIYCINGIEQRFQVLIHTYEC